MCDYIIAIQALSGQVTQIGHYVASPPDVCITTPFMGRCTACVLLKKNNLQKHRGPETMWVRMSLKRQHRLIPIYVLYSGAELVWGFPCIPTEGIKNRHLFPGRVDSLSQLGLFKY